MLQMTRDQSGFATRVSIPPAAGIPELEAELARIASLPETSRAALVPEIQALRFRADALKRRPWLQETR